MRRTPRPESDNRRGAIVLVVWPIPGGCRGTTQPFRSDGDRKPSRIRNVRTSRQKISLSHNLSRASELSDRLQATLGGLRSNTCDEELTPGRTGHPVTRQGAPYLLNPCCGR